MARNSQRRVSAQEAESQLQEHLPDMSQANRGGGMKEPLYYIIEHPRRGCLMDLEETDAGKTGRFSWSGSRTDAMHFHSIGQAVTALEKIDRSVGCEIRSSHYDHKNWNGSWPVVWPVARAS
jgi:hypothetical protein